MSKIDVTVVVPTYRRETLLPGAVESALSQNGVTVEVIVVDDSVEGTAAEVVRAIDDSRVRYFHRAKPSGGFPGAVRNDGARWARADLLHFLDDDDRLVVGALEELKASLFASGKGMAFGRVLPFGDDDVPLRDAQRTYFRRAASIAKEIRSRRWFAANLLFREMLLINSACMMRRDVFELHGGYEATLRCCEDVDLFIRVSRSHGFAFVNRDVLHYRVGAPSIMTESRRAGAGMDPAQLASYRHMHSRYKREYGVLEYRALQVLARTGTLVSRAIYGSGR